MQVSGFSGSLYEGFNSREEAYSAWIRYWATNNIHTPESSGIASAGSGIGGCETYPMPAGVKVNDASQGITESSLVGQMKDGEVSEVGAQGSKCVGSCNEPSKSSANY
ncbi:hypothetical protein SESBI_49673 [Sesbania bispinosa]|nr:hypothetical protein SESBI_49673 [Sesbania bispinosa]